MKNILKTLAFMVIGLAMTSIVACEKDDTDTPSYAIHYNGAVVADGETIVYNPGLNEINMDWATIELLPENKTSNTLETVMKIELVEGPADMNDLSICYGETCKTGVAPWTSDPFNLTAGLNQNMLIKFDYTPSKVTEKTTYRLTLGNGSSMKNPYVVYINVN